MSYEPAPVTQAEHAALVAAEQQAEKADRAGCALYCRIIWDAARSYDPGQEKQFPIMPARRRDSTIAPHPMKVPWSIAELAYSVYVRHGGGDQSLERLAERGGFGASEMDMFLPDWRERVAALRGKSS